MPPAKKVCIVCEKNIDVTRGQEIKRCYYCNNAICNRHFSFCRLCTKMICDNELRKCDYCPFDQCKNCTIKYKNNKSNSISLCCLECSTDEKNKT